ncbi:MAG TPA: RNA polymerase [Muricauda sp.]|uniref:RNA polymerase sigma-70 factor n=1 Tax=Flagellimonas aurea TaxID=2915619 RepID=A0ABS3G5H0_9FLAO|nr:RNA polymerase sigma-70 factor [Allomuricauda aurea]MAO16244.1 RNA polymerase [Allomuricauda sp.]MBO0354663.1 RNA polymerase sigma-70 factor [Allomuricauda aurea]HBU78774.1 RNA polymerase [Allomuricauda sp.]|tara:strand:+ start:338 stop:928 length:591 start_codon:yes stop_codon:yes gene_type:complete
MKSKASTYKELNQKSDLELFQLIKQREKGALEAVFNRYYESLCRFGIAYENDLDVVQEKVSDVFIQLWNSHDRIHEIQKPKPYLYVVVKNKLMEPVSYQKLKQTLDKGVEDEYSTSPSIEQEIIDQEQREMYVRKIQEILDQIPKKSRQIFEMSRLDELKYKEISEILGVSIKTVESHMAIALRTIRNMVVKNKQF